MAAAAMTFQVIIDELLHATGASRTTLRLEEPGGDFPVVAEALAPGIRSIKGGARVPVRNSATFAFFERERRILVVNDCRTSDPPTPQELMDFYGVRAENPGAPDGRRADRGDRLGAPCAGAPRVDGGRDRGAHAGPRAHPG